MLSEWGGDYKNLGILEADPIKETEIKEKKRIE